MRSSCVKLIILFFAIPFSLSAQTVFHRGFFDTTGTYDVMVTDILLAGNGDYLLALQKKGLIRTDPDGNPVWMKDYAINGSSFQIRQIISIEGGDLLLLGINTKPNTSESRDTTAICRITANGDPVWSKTLSVEAPGGIMPRYAILTANGEILLCASQNSSGSNYTVATRMTIQGDVLWQHYYLNYSNPGITRQFYTWNVIECQNGDFLLMGFGSQPTDNIITRLNSLGVIQWANKYNAYDYVNNIGQRPHAAYELPDGSFHVSIDGAMPSYGIGLITLDAAGNVQGDGKAYKTPYYISSNYTVDGKLVFLGNGQVIKTDILGDIDYCFKYQGIFPYTNLSDFCINTDESITIVGSYQQSFFDPAYTYFVKTKVNGEAPPYNSIDLTMTDTIYSNAATPISLLDSIVSFPLQSAELTVQPFTIQDTVYAIELSIQNLSVTENRNFIFPNPASNLIHFNTVGTVDAMIYNTSGQLVKAASQSNSIDISSLPSGLYVIRFYSKNNDYNSAYRFVKE